MKRLVILLLIILPLKICSFSQTISTKTEQESTVSITTDELKYANLIFAEHGKLLIENDLLNQEVENLKLQLIASDQLDHNRIKQLQTYYELDQERVNQINKLENDLKQKKKSKLGWEIGCITVSVAVVTALVFLFR